MDQFDSISFFFWFLRERKGEGTGKEKGRKRFFGTVTLWQGEVELAKCGEMERKERLLCWKKKSRLVTRWVREICSWMRYWIYPSRPNPAAFDTPITLHYYYFFDTVTSTSWVTLMPLGDKPSSMSFCGRPSDAIVSNPPFRT